MHVKDSLSNLIGKVINGVVVAQHARGNPSSRIFLTFSDGTAFEFWEYDGTIEMAGGLDEGGVDHIVKILERREGTTINAFRPPYQDPDEPQQDLLPACVEIGEKMGSNH